MYGMVNKAMEKMVVDFHGADTWTRIRERAGCDIEDFVRMEAYPDAVTYGLVGAAVEELGEDPAALLHAFGVYWISYAQESGYRDFFQSCDSYISFVQQLDAMHARLQLAFRELRAPQFACTVLSPTSVRVVYRSRRHGLASFVIGLFEGLGPVFNVKARVEKTAEQVSEEAGVEIHYQVLLEPA
jgi:Haem-NO-binding